MGWEGWLEMGGNGASGDGKNLISTTTYPQVWIQNSSPSPPTSLVKPESNG